MVYLIIFVFKFVDCLLGTLKNKTMIYGYDRISNVLKAFSAMIFIVAISKVLTDKSITAVLIIGLAEFIGGEVGNFIFNRVHKKRKKEKPYEFFIRFNDIKTCMIVNNELKAFGIETYHKNDSKKLIVDSKNRIESRLIDDVIEGKFKDLKKNELKYRE